MPIMGCWCDNPPCGNCPGDRAVPATSTPETTVPADSSVTKLELVTVGENFRFDADELIEKAKGRGFVKLAILAENPDGTTWVSGSANAGETLILIELAKHKIVHGD